MKVLTSAQNHQLIILSLFILKIDNKTLNIHRLGRIIFKMVYYFKSSTVDPSAYIYVGKDKFESELPRIPGLSRPRPIRC